MTKYRILYEDPDAPDAPLSVVVPSSTWLEKAMSGDLPPISVYWSLKEDEERAIAAGRHGDFAHDPAKLAKQKEHETTGPMTEEEAMYYLLLKDVPRRVWGFDHNRTMFRIVTADQVPSDRRFRNAWRLAA